MISGAFCPELCSSTGVQTLVLRKVLEGKIGKRMEIQWKKWLKCIPSTHVQNHLQIKEAVRLANSATQQVVTLTRECNYIILDYIILYYTLYTLYINMWLLKTDVSQFGHPAAIDQDTGPISAWLSWRYFSRSQATGPNEPKASCCFQLKRWTSAENDFDLRDGCLAVHAKIKQCCVPNGWKSPHQEHVLFASVVFTTSRFTVQMNNEFCSRWA